MLREQIIPALSMEYKTNFRSHKRKQARNDKNPHCSSPSKLPRITRLMALAHHLQELIDQGIVHDYADIARLTGLSRARLTQIMNFRLLAPQIQEDIIFATAMAPIPNYLKERALRMILKTSVWDEQLKIWKKLKASKLHTGQ